MSDIEYSIRKSEIMLNNIRYSYSKPIFDQIIFEISNILNSSRCQCFKYSICSILLGPNYILSHNIMCCVPEKNMEFGSSTCDNLVTMLN